jgi:hypothetical protein
LYSMPDRVNQRGCPEVRGALVAARDHQACGNGVSMNGDTDRFGCPFQRVVQGSQVQVAVDAAELLPASTIPATHWHSATVPSHQRLTLLA